MMFGLPIFLNGLIIFIHFHAICTDANPMPLELILSDENKALQLPIRTIRREQNAELFAEIEITKSRIARSTSNKRPKIKNYVHPHQSNSESEESSSYEDPPQGFQHFYSNHHHIIQYIHRGKSGDSFNWNIGMSSSSSSSSEESQNKKRKKIKRKKVKKKSKKSKSSPPPTPPPRPKPKLFPVLKRTSLLSTTTTNRPPTSKKATPPTSRTSTPKPIPKTPRPSPPPPTSLHLKKD